MYGITHEKRGRRVWWIVNFTRRGRAYYRRFSATKYGSSKAALRAAIAWRNKSLTDKAVFTLREFHQQKRSNNTSGVPGVTFLQPKKQPLGSWQAKISLAGRLRLCRQFSVRKFGYAEAFARAVAARSEFLDRVDDRPYLTNRTAVRAIRPHKPFRLGPRRRAVTPFCTWLTASAGSTPASTATPRHVKEQDRVTDIATIAPELFER